MISSNKPPFLRHFLGIDRFAALWARLKEESAKDCSPKLDTLSVSAGVVVVVTPLVLTILHHAERSPVVDLSVVAFAVCTLLALMLRKRFHLPRERKDSWKEALSLTHTAFALGCIPAVILLAMNPELFSNRHDILTSAVEPIAGDGPIGGVFMVAQNAILVVIIAAWAAITEELLFRGLLVGVLRRWKLIPTQKLRDVFAVVASSVLFGAAHYPTWGLIPALALTGLGVGFVLGYIASRENLTPLVFYHFCFDMLSIFVVLLT